MTGEGLPAAMLPYCGRSMLEGQVRDLQAQEYLYWHLTGTQVGRGRVVVLGWWRLVARTPFVSPSSSQHSQLACRQLTAPIVHCLSLPIVC